MCYQYRLPAVQEQIAIFTSVLVARQCFSLTDVLAHVVQPSLKSARVHGNYWVRFLQLDPESSCKESLSVPLRAYLLCALFLFLYWVISFVFVFFDACFSQCIGCFSGERSEQGVRLTCMLLQWLLTKPPRSSSVTAPSGGIFNPGQFVKSGTRSAMVTSDERRLLAAREMLDLPTVFTIIRVSVICRFVCCGLLS